MSPLRWYRELPPASRAHRFHLRAMKLGWAVLVACCAMELLGLSWLGIEVTALLLLGGLFVWFWSTLLALFLPGFRQQWPRLLTVGVAGLLALIATLPLREACRMVAFRWLAFRSEPLVEAIHAYEQRRGVPPPTLDSLVPEFLSAVPDTGRWDFPAYSYEVHAPEHPGTARWRLSVSCSRGLLNWDEFIYSPSDEGLDPSLHRVTRLGDWGYLHE